MSQENGTLIAYLEDEKSECFMTDSIYDNLAFYQNINTDEKVGEYAGAIYNWFIRECVQRNQYIRFPDESYREILALYRALVIKLRRLAPTSGESSRKLVRGFVHSHRAALIAILSGIKNTDEKQTTILPCAEYSADFQFQILGLDRIETASPFLDIGCGEKAALVEIMRTQGIQAVGIDQYQPATNDGGILRANWLEFTYLSNYWGTIVSHMSFSNHFTRALKIDPELAAWYQAVYMDILDALKIGGVFCYTPALYRAETFIDKHRFSITHWTNIPGEPDLDTTHIRRIAL